MKQRIGVNKIVTVVALFIVAMFSFELFRHESSLKDNVLEIIGILLILIGQLLRVSSRGYKSEHSQGGHVLVHDGPYSLVRNPMYLGIIAVGLGVVLFLFKPWLLLVFSLGFVICYWRIFPREEKELIQSFGQKYSEYKQRVPLLIPNPRFIFTTPVYEYLPLRKRWFIRESSGIGLVLLFVIFAKLAEESNFIPPLTVLAHAAVLAAILIVYMATAILLASVYENKRSRRKNITK